MTDSAYVPEGLRSWNVPWAQYAPVDITPPELQPEGIAKSVDEGWAEGVTDPQTIDFLPRRAAAIIYYQIEDGVPLNPRGRTGRSGRNLGLWGENRAADPIVIANTPDGPHVLLIKRTDCGQWAIPGGMVDPGESAPSALVRELREETGLNLIDVKPELLERTYIDDPRNTDHAWISSTVVLYRLPDQLEVTAGDDAADARWWPMESIDTLISALKKSGAELYSAHKPHLAHAAFRYNHGLEYDEMQEILVWHDTYYTFPTHLA